MVVAVGGYCEGGARGFKSTGPSIVVCVGANRVKRSEYVCFVSSIGGKGVLSVFALLVGAFVVCISSSFEGRIIGLQLQVRLFIFIREVAPPSVRAASNIFLDIAGWSWVSTAANSRWCHSIALVVGWSLSAIILHALMSLAVVVFAAKTEYNVPG